MWRETVLVPRELGDFTSAPGNSSDIITIESPILITAFMIVPPGPGAREISFAPNAFLYQSIAWPAPWMAKYGVTVRSPAGIALAPSDAFRLVALPRFAFRTMNTPRVGNGVCVLSLAGGGGRNAPLGRTGYRTAFRIKTELPSGPTRGKPSRSNIPTVPNHIDCDPPFVETTGCASTVPPPCLRIDARAARRAATATPCLRWSLSTTKQAILHRGPSSLRSSLR